MDKKESFEPLDILVRHRIKNHMVGYVMCGGIILSGILSWQFFSWHIFMGFIIFMSLVLLVYTHRTKQKIQKKIQEENKRNLEKILKDLHG